MWLIRLHFYISCFLLKFAVFEPGTRNTGTAIAGKNIANPISMMNAAVDLLDHLHLENHAQWLREAIDKTINEDRIHTPGK
jgi:isocitrate dehydrogenase (NAD+)